MRSARIIIEKALTERLTRCTGYLGHPFKNKYFETEKDLPPLLAKAGGWVYHQKSSTAYSYSNTTIFM